MFHQDYTIINCINTLDFAPTHPAMKVRSSRNYLSEYLRYFSVVFGRIFCTLDGFMVHEEAEIQAIETRR